MKKRPLLGGVAALTLLIAPGRDAKAEIPVIDTAAIGEWVTSIGNEVKSYGLELEGYLVQAKQWATQNLQWLQQIQSYALQANQYLAETMMVLNFIHNPSLGALMGLMNMAGLGNSLPVNPYAVMGMVYGIENFGNGGSGLGAVRGILSSLSQISGQAWNTAHIYTPVDRSWASAQLVQTANSTAGMSGVMSAAYGDTVAHSATLQPIRTGLLNSSDTKSVLDATGQAAVETAWNVNQLAKIQATTGSYLAQQDIRRQRDDECMVMSIDAFLSTAPPGSVSGLVPANPGPCPPVPPPLPAGGTVFGGTAGGGPGTNTIAPDAPLPLPPVPPAPDPTIGSVNPQQAAALDNQAPPAAALAANTYGPPAPAVVYPPGTLLGPQEPFDPAGNAGPSFPATPVLPVPTQGIPAVGTPTAQR